MLAGQSATQQCFSTGPAYGGLLPADVDGTTPPPTGSPNYLVALGATNTELAMWKFHVDFANPANSTFTGPTNVTVAGFGTTCANNGTRNCIPQAGTTAGLDGIEDRLMYRLSYRNYGSHESLYVNHSVDAGTSVGARWYELRNIATTPTVAQQSTYAPDAKYRWMGSIASDQQGNLALGYSHSSSVDHPGIRVTGRLASDPASTMQSETVLFTGGGSQNDTYYRWGDYSSMSLDPSDDCTFWYTNEYYATTGSFNWSTRIGSFKFPNCGGTPAPDLTIAKSHTGNFTQGQNGAQYTITVSNVGSAATSGTVTVTDTLPAGLTATALSGTGWSNCTLSPLSCRRSDVLAAGASYPALTLTVNVASNAPGSVTNSVTVSGGGETNTSNDTANDPTTINAAGGTPDLTIAKSHSGNFTQGQNGAQYTITVSNVGTAATSGTVNVTDALPAGLTATAFSGTGWSNCTLSPLSCSRSDALAKGASYPPLTLTVSVAANAPASVTNSATVSGGGETNTSNDTANDPTTINGSGGGTPDLSITKTHVGNFTKGQVGAHYTITVSNVGGAATSGKVYLYDTVPTGLTATAISGTGWTCSLKPVSCSRRDSLAAGSAYPSITLTVNVSSTAPSSVTNTVSVSGGGDNSPKNDTAKDPTTIN
ncbi:MAG: hypothetical protein JOZ43_06955 [Acidobacteriales bacterium]|nr:hypothetical protein [Terriglobales bacterium]